ncbi:MAG: hypothetical protein AVO34_01260 [Firmicutes bacterium ML8_F2]|jgi:V/A-type H+/Na+-transporting ATPase subunit G/H|nr:MAG: hypothetical protein AVO34_01260 [Firmicutes bacterium ML8_F2]
MTVELVKAIKEAEAKADRLIRDVRQDARRKLKEAKEEGEVIVGKAAVEAGEQAEALIEKAREEANAEVEPLNAEQKQEIACVQSLAADKLSEAVSLLVDKVVKHDAQH